VNKILYGSSNLIETGKDNEIQATTLIQLSGGIDSVYVLWKWLVDNPDEYCLVHHIKLIDFEQNYNFELEAVDKILRWLDNKGLKNYFYVQNTFDYGNFSSCIPDSEICGFHAGILLRLPRWYSINKVLLPIYNIRSDAEKLQKGGREYNRLELMKTISMRDDYESIYTFGIYPDHMDKTDVIKAIPKELLNLCWYCRTPLNNKRCGICFTCESVDKSLEKVDNDLLLNFITQSELKNKKD
jgi:hypothetical protein